MRSGGSSIDWEVLFMGLVDGTISGDITLKSTVTSIKTYCFYNCVNLTGVDAPNVVGIGAAAFYGAEALKDLNIGTLQSVGASAFQDCKNLEAPIIIGNNVTTLGTTVFFNCYKIPYIDVGTGVTSIGNQCFRYLNDCQYVIMRPTSPPTLGLLNFIGGTTGTYPIYVPDASVNTYKAASGWDALASRIFSINDMP